MVSGNRDKSNSTRSQQAWRAALCASVAFSFASPVFAQDVVEVQQEAANQAEDDKVLDTIVVTGIRSSLKKAAELKRDSSQVIDAIVAEDIGKLPDNNIAEALQRVTGVSINRDFGVGNAVSIRGLPQNRVEINGRSTLGDARQGISLDDMPAAFLSQVEVIKSPTPEMIEGALGGTVNMKTLRPLELSDRVLSVSVDAEYADKTENIAPIINGTYGDKWDLGAGGSFGVVASLSYQDRELRQDQFQQDLRVQSGFDWNDDGTIGVDEFSSNTPSGNYIISREHKYEPWVEHRERTAANVSLQWAPANDRGNFYFDFNYTDRDGGQEAYSVLQAGGSATNANGTAVEKENGELTGFVLEGSNFILPKTWSTFRSTESFSNALGGDWDFTDSLNVSFEFASAKSDQKTPASEFNWRAHDQAAEALDPAGQNRLFIDSLIDTSSHGSVPGVTYLNGVENPYLNQEALALREFRHRTDDIENAEDAFRIDVEYANPGGLSWFTAAKAGVRVTDRSYERNRSEFRSPNLHQDLTSADGSEYIVWTMAEFANLYPGTLVTPYSGTELFDQAGYTSENQTAPFTLYNAALLSQDLEGTFGIFQELVQGTNREVTGTLQDNLAFSESAYTKIEEDTQAFYVQGEFDFDVATVVAGARFVDTEITASAYQDGVIVTDTESYSDLLPSINITVPLSDNTVLRASGAKVMRRADFGELSPAYDFNSDVVTASRGNPGLEPYRATQFDFAVEHYWGEANMLSATVFYKDVASFLQSSIYCAYEPEAVASQNQSIPSQICLLPEGVTEDSFTYSSAPDGTDEGSALWASLRDRAGVQTTTQTNGQNGTIQGFELGLVYNFDFLPGLWSGFGVNTNYTYSESTSPSGTPLEDISKNSYNFQVFWEYDAFAARLAYSHRGRFLDDTTQKRTEHIGLLVASNTIDLDNDPTQGNSFRDEISQLDFSASWDVNDWLTVVGSATNLTGEPLISSSAQGVMWEIQESDSRYSLGVRAKF